MMKNVAIFDAALVVIYAVLFLLQLWNKTFSDEFFAKLSLTTLILIGVATVVGLIYQEFVKNQEMKKDNYLS